jgi:two-component system response regulator DevR
MLVDDHEVVRDGIRSLLEATDDIVVCAEAGSVREAVAVAERTLPDVIVMDVRLQDGSGIEATRDIRAARPATNVLMLTSFADDEALFASILAGAAGYVLKQIRGDELVTAIRRVGQGQSLLDPSVTKGVLDRLRKGKHLLMDEKLARLSPQEERILGQHQQGDRRGAGPGREDRQELRVQHPGQARGDPSGRGRRLPRPPHHHPGSVTTPTARPSHCPTATAPTTASTRPIPARRVCPPSIVTTSRSRRTPPTRRSRTRSTL